MKVHPDNAPFKNYDTLYNDYWNEVLSLSQIASKYNVNVTTIKYWFREFEIPSRTKEEQGKLIWNTYRVNEKAPKIVKPILMYKNYDILYHEHWDSKLSLYEIAEKYNVKPATIQYWFKKLKVPTRNKYEAIQVAKDKGRITNHNERKLSLIVQCGNCGKEIERWNYYIKKSQFLYCSKECKAEHWSKIHIGENAFNWKGGTWKETVDKRQWSKYQKARKRVRERDQYTCQLCGIVKKGRGLEVHHIIPVKDDINRIFDETNMITLCITCHRDKVNNHEYEYLKVFTDIVVKTASQ